MNRQSPQPGEIWRHRKYDPDGPENNYTYEIIGVARDTETGITNVVYKPLYNENTYLDEVGAQLYVRPLDMFLDEDPEKGQRFVKII